MIQQTVIRNNALKPPTHHWLWQRISAIILIPLSFKLIVFLNLCLTAPYHTTLEWLSAPTNLVWLMLWLVFVFYHAAMGLQVVVEDYIADKKLQNALIKLINSSFIVMALVSLFFMFRSI